MSQCFMCSENVHDTGSVTLYVDIFFVDTLIFLGTISRKIKDTTSTQIDG